MRCTCCVAMPGGYRQPPPAPKRDFQGLRSGSGAPITAYGRLALGKCTRAGEVRVAERPVEPARRAVGVDGGEDRALFGGAVGDPGDEGAADAVALEAGVDVQFGDHEGAVEPVLVAAGAQVRLDDRGPPVRAVVRHPVHEPGERPVVGVRAEGAGSGAGHVALHDPAPDADLLLAEPEGHGLDAQRLVHAGGEVERADAESGGPVGVEPGRRQHAATLLRGPGAPVWRRGPGRAIRPSGRGRRGGPAGGRRVRTGRS